MKREEHATDGQTGEENVQSDTAVELAGEASERDQAKEVRHTLTHTHTHAHTHTRVRIILVRIYH